jgi:HK97 gp10 family phage protein
MAAVVREWKVDDDALSASLRQSTVGAFLEQKAAQGVEAARGLAPVRTGRYRDSLHVVPARVEGDHLMAGIGTDSWYWHFVEFGTWHNPVERVLTRAGESVSERLELT